MEKLFLAVLFFTSSAFGQLSISGTCPSATVGVSYSCQLSVNATGATWEIVNGALPAGLSLTNGLISGTPSTAGNFSAAIQATVFGQKTVAISVASQTVTPAPNPSQSLCGSMQWVSGYALWNVNVGRPNLIHYIAFRPSKTGSVGFLKYYNSSGSHALQDACSKYYSSVNPCNATCGLPQYRNTAPSDYKKACPNGWWPFAQTCSSNYSGCYSGGTGGVFKATLTDSTGKALTSVTVNQPNVAYGFASVYPVVPFTEVVPIIAGQLYYLKVEDVDSNPAQNYSSLDAYTPYNLFTAAQVKAQNLMTATLGGKTGVADARYESTLGGSTETNYQPIFALGFADSSTGTATGYCVSQGFAP